MNTEKTCETCKFCNKGNPLVCLAEACYEGDMWEPEEPKTQDHEDTVEDD